MLLAAALLVLGLVVPVRVPAAAAAPAPPTTTPVGPGPVVRYRSPVDAPVVDRFRAPSTPYGPGNRGWEYATVPGTPVVAAGDGTVGFAGAVAGRLVATVAHADGLRTTYTGLATLVVRAGQVVQGGDRLGTATDRLHVGVRRGDTYLDPAGILPEPGTAAGDAPAPRPVVRLVPVRR